MLNRVKFASVAVFVVGLSGAVFATPYSETSDNFESDRLPFGYEEDGRRLTGAATFDRRKTKRTLNSTNYLISGNQPEVFSKSRQTNPTPSIKKLMILADLTPSKAATFNPDNRNNFSIITSTGNDSRKIQNMAPNQRYLPGPAPMRSAAERKKQGQELSSSRLNPVLETQLDNTLMGTAKDVISPSFIFASSIPTNVFKLNEMPLLGSPATNEIQVLDFKSQQLITVNQSTKQKSTPQEQSNSAAGKSRLILSVTGQTNGAIEYLKTVKLFIAEHLPYVVSGGLFLITFVFFSSCRLEKRA